MLIEHYIYISPSLSLYSFSKMSGEVSYFPATLLSITSSLADSRPYNNKFSGVHYLVDYFNFPLHR